MRGLCGYLYLNIYLLTPRLPARAARRRLRVRGGARGARDLRAHARGRRRRGPQPPVPERLRRLERQAVEPQGSGSYGLGVIGD